MEIQAVMHHFQLKKCGVGCYMLLPGDPRRCASIGSYCIHVAAHW
jgi:uridine phosphorylase